MISYRYKDRGTVIYKLNPFCKLAWLSGILVLALIFDNPLYILLLFLATLPMVIIAKVWKEWASFMRFTSYLCLAVVVINALVSHQGNHVICQAPFSLPIIGIPRITLEAICCGAGNAMRLLAIISAFFLVTFTIHPDELMLALMKMKLPYKSVLVTSLSTRFVPTLFEDVERITDVQRSRGLELDKGRMLQRIKGRMTVIIPLISNSLDRTVQVAEAMESRAFGVGKGRTFYRGIGMSKLDIITFVLAFSPCILGAVMRSRGYGDYQYYPTVEQMSFNGLECSMLVLLMLLLSVILFMAFLKERIDLD